jgi:hypothetical protein
VAVLSLVLVLDQKALDKVSDKGSVQVSVQVLD